VRQRRRSGLQPTGPPTPTSGAPADPTTALAQDIVAGRVVAGELARHAAERHLKDLKDGAKRGLYWRPDLANEAIRFYPTVLTITAGYKAGHPFELLPWTLFCAGNLFGWVTASGRLRFRHGWFETGKGQAKSPFMAATALYFVGFRGVPRAEGYAIAWDKDQANVPFKDAVAMCRAPIPPEPGDPVDEGDTLESRGAVVIRGTLDNAWKIEFPGTGSKFQSVANGENISGPRPNFVLADEIHEFKSDHPLEIWKRAIAKMPGDALMLLGTNTPAAVQITGTQYSEFYQKVSRGDIVDDEAFAFIARVDKDDKPFEDESCWQKSLPALGITFPIENIRGEVNTAKVLLSTALSVKRLYFGIPVGSVAFWIAEEAWAAVQGEVNPDALKGCKCWLSLDLSKKNDLTALTATWDKDGHLFSKTWYWTTMDGLRDRSIADNAPYDQWVHQGFLTAVPGSVIDKTFVAEEVAALVAEHDVEGLVFDSAGMPDFMDACEDVGLAFWLWEGADTPKGNGLKLVKHNQGKRRVFEDRQLTMPTSIERLEDKILDHGITIENSPVTYSCAANAMIDSDGQGNRCFDKRRSRGRIDGLVTVAMGCGAITADVKAVTPEYRVYFI
jgi:phage terminase large subunit-like protein